MATFRSSCLLELGMGGRTASLPLGLTQAKSAPEAFLDPISGPHRRTQTHVDGNLRVSSQHHDGCEAPRSALGDARRHGAIDAYRAKMMALEGRAENSQLGSELARLVCHDTQPDAHRRNIGRIGLGHQRLRRVDGRSHRHLPPGSLP
ncbi:MAG TPA: hypothetical protein VFU02_08665, partial [Polyangiaceae bacterium]|nr:hypothetical protein [Polyangiaceae bacterium]